MNLVQESNALQSRLDSQRLGVAIALGLLLSRCGGGAEGDVTNTDESSDDSDATEGAPEATDAEESDADDELACLDALDLDCSLTFAPNFRSIFDNRLQTTCGAAGSSCHGDDGAQGGLVLTDFDDAYDALLEGDGDRGPRVIPGDPECSLLMIRLETSDAALLMPVGSQLPEGERCAVRQWIAEGAEK